MKKIVLITAALSLCGPLYAQNTAAEPELINGVMNGNVSMNGNGSVDTMHGYDGNMNGNVSMMGVHHAPKSVIFDHVRDTKPHQRKEAYHEVSCERDSPF